MKLDRPLVLLDLETTGPNPLEDRIVQIGCVRLRTDGESDERSWLINPGIPIPAEATKVHGITDAMVAAAPTFKAMASRLLNGLEGADLGGYNIIPYDLPLLRAELARCDLTLDMKDRRVIDVMRIYFQLAPRTLAAAYKEFTGSDLAGAHGALEDARASGRVLQGMIERHALSASVEDLAKLSQPDGALDLSGKFIEKDGRIVVNFGQHKGKDASKVEPSFFRWLLSKDFDDDTKAIARQILGC